MSAPKFTPGPWEARDGAAYADGVLIADCVGEQWRAKARISEGDTMEANAALIAAAPRMADYIRARAEAGDAEAQEIWEAIVG